ncbi:hypothetical protein N2152v2_007197 [Parachlorella kessleri]
MGSSLVRGTAAKLAERSKSTKFTEAPPVPLDAWDLGGFSLEVAPIAAADESQHEDRSDGASAFPAGSTATTSGSSRQSSRSQSLQDTRIVAELQEQLQGIAASAAREQQEEEEEQQQEQEGNDGSRSWRAGSCASSGTGSDVAASPGALLAAQTLWDSGWEGDEQGCAGQMMVHPSTSSIVSSLAKDASGAEATSSAAASPAPGPLSPAPKAASAPREGLQSDGSIQSLSQQGDMAAAAAVAIAEAEAAAALAESADLQRKLRHWKSQARSQLLPLRLGVHGSEERARQSEAAARKLSGEKKALEQAFGEVRSLFKQASLERQDLGRQLDAARAQGAEHAGAAQELRGALDLANRQAAELASELANARQELARTQEDARALGQAEREALQLRIAAFQAETEGAKERARAADARAAEAVAAKEAAERERQEADRLRREAEGQAEAAAAAAAAERAQRAEAEGQSEALKAEGERRARVFNAAVKAAVGKIQGGLEEERQQLQARVDGLEGEAAGLRQQVTQLTTALQEQHHQLQARTANAQGAGLLAAEAQAGLAVLQGEMQQLRERQAADLAAREAAERRLSECQALLDKAQQEAATANQELDRRRSDREGSRERQEAAVVAGQAEAQRWRQEAEAAREALRLAEERAATLAQDARVVSQSAMTEASTARSRVVELEEELASLKGLQKGTQGSTAAGLRGGLHTAAGLLQSLGLESGSGSGRASPVRIGGKGLATEEGLMSPRRSTSSGSVAAPVVVEMLRRLPLRPTLAGSARSAEAPAGGRQRSQLSVRALLLVAYVVVLHVMVMVMGSRMHPGGCLGGGRDATLPG